MFTLTELQDLRDGKNTHEELAQLDRDAYLRGRRMYPTSPDEGLPQGFSERDRGCYMMGFNVTMWENGHV